MCRKVFKFGREWFKNFVDGNIVSAGSISAPFSQLDSLSEQSLRCLHVCELQTKWKWEGGGGGFAGITPAATIQCAVLERKEIPCAHF